MCVFSGPSQAPTHFLFTGGKIESGTRSSGQTDETQKTISQLTKTMLDDGIILHSVYSISLSHTYTLFRPGRIPDPVLIFDPEVFFRLRISYSTSEY